MDTGAARRGKRLVICCDGTWNRPDSDHVTNIEKIARTVATDLDRTGGVQQLVLYLAGVGAGYAADRLLGGAFGFGLFANVRSAYRFLALNYEPGDEIFVFGFSRGAYTARSLVGMVGRVGLLTRDALVADKLPEAVARYQRRSPGDGSFGESDEEFRRDHCHPQAPVHLLGVFDTVGALGVPGAVRKRHQFHDVNLSKAVLCARQALAVDERRIKFEPCLWEADEETRRDDEATGRVQQVWFEGAHSDVGGGYPDTGLSDTALLWMVTEANRRGLVFDTRLLAVYVGGGSSAVRHDSLTVLYRVLNLLSRTRAAITRSGRRFHGSWRRLDPPPAANARQQWAVGVRIASSTSQHFHQDPAYRGPNVVEYAEQTDAFAGRVADVVALPEAPGAVDDWLAAHGVDLGAPPAR
jgi:type VI secretion system (T6SS) phospholipase Tle1-like effector